MFLICSASYCNSELQSEFGKIPPSFLPLGNRRLFQHQIERIPLHKKKYLSLPEHFSINSYDKKWLNTHNVEIIHLPENLSLGESIVSAINLTGNYNCKSISILFGDTLLLKYPDNMDCFTVSHITENYDWAFVDKTKSNTYISNNTSLSEQENNHLILNGYFNFSDCSLFVKSIILKKWNFIDALNYYKKNKSFIDIEIQDWLDFGHIHTYFRSKTFFTTQRVFNNLIISEEFVKKSGTNILKLKAEAQWFQNIPGTLRKNTPHLIECIENKNNEFSYTLEYLHNVACNEIYVFSTLPSVTWNKILDSCFSFISKCILHKGEKYDNSSCLTQIFTSKTKERINEFCLSKDINVNENWSYNNKYSFSISELIELANKNLPKEKVPTSIIHGDFCFSNILYDFRSSSIKVIDPRGLSSNNEITIFGDFRYDIAKLAHSVIGQYDWIIAGYSNANIHKNNISFTIIEQNDTSDIKCIFINKVRDLFNVSYSELLAMQIHLFLSMLPLHSDDEKRQLALFANAFRLGVLLKEETK